jgi:uncharacterized membrane protein
MSKAVIGVFRQEARAKEAINDLKTQGFGDKEISLIAKDKREEAADRGGDKGRGDNLTMAHQDLSTGAGALLIPGVGPIVAAGPLAAFLTGVVGGGIVGGLVDYGIPKERGRHFENRVKQGDILVTMKVNDNDANKVISVLKRYGAEDVESH